MSTRVSDEGRWSVAVLLAITVLLFLPTLLGYFDAWQSFTYAHGYLIAPVTVWLIWRERDRLRTGGPVVSLSGAILGGAVLSLVWLIAQVTQIRTVGQAVFPVLLLTWAAGVLGRNAARRLIPVAAIFLLAVPVWDVLVPPLRSLTVVVSTVALGLLRVPAVIEGNVVEIRYGSFIIADGCSGLSYLLAGLTIGAIYAHVLVRRWPARCAVVGLAGGLAIVGNWVRVSSLIVIGDVTRMQSSLIEAHLVHGWAIFSVGSVLFLALAGRIERATAPSQPPQGGARAEETPAPSGPIQVRHAILITLAVVLGPAAYYVVGALPSRDPAAPALPATRTVWRPVQTPANQPLGWLPAFSGADEHLGGSWTDGSRRVQVDRLVYREQRQGLELIGYGNQIASDSVLVAQRLMGPVGSRGRLVNEAIVRHGDAHLLVWYWYRVGGAETESAVRAKLLEVRAFVTRTNASELVALSAPCAADSCAEAHEALSNFLGST